MIPAKFGEKPTVLIVDDTPDNLTILADLLKILYRVKAARDGAKALQIAASDDKPDLILLDVMMPGMSGFEVCRQLKAQPETRDIPVIFLTTLGAAEDELRGLELGAVDYITKPINPPTVLLRVDNHLKLKAASDFLRDQNGFLEREVARRTQEVVAIQDVTIQALASLAETRDNETGNHIRRTQFYVQLLAEQVKEHPRFAAELDSYTRNLLFKSAPLHDIGKIGIPDSILLKPGRLTAEEFEVMKTHTTLGRDALQRAEDGLGIEVPFLRLAKEIAYSHQEKWDGSGYPEGKAGEDIPLSARLMAVADVYDALTSQRVYKPGMPHEDAVALISEQRGRHFDPDLVDAFLAIQEEFAAIARRYTDAAPPPLQPESARAQNASA
ncbi:two-component system response regulator [Pseudomonas sp. UL073]|uniref:Two-component system response regulator n=1 Tax=Zestomonas insulae TaxID=2809017 RepID=A0ABS2IB15_9GAMM|nr:two-component system response regulator [Pseudomonas insulae]MBM7060311.1 two-component system response regulator [Pseudomonas insulae]